MTTPIYNFVQNYIKSGKARFHMPGHKGKSFLGIEPFDITEIKGADELYSPSGIIAESEENATKLFDTAHTFYSTEGSTLAIKAMLALALKDRPAQSRPTLLAGRNAHKALIFAAALLDFDVEWLYGDDSHACECKTTPDALRARLSAMSALPFAVYILSRVCTRLRSALRCVPIQRTKPCPSSQGAHICISQSERRILPSVRVLCFRFLHRQVPLI